MFRTTLIFCLLASACSTAPDPEKIPEYVATLSMPVSSAEKREAMRSLLELGEPAVPYLADALEDDREDDIGWVAVTLTVMGPVASSACPALLDQLRGADEGSPPADRAAWALSRIGPPAVPYLVEALTDDDTALRRHVLVALSWMDPEVDLSAAMPAVIQCYESATRSGDDQTASLASIVIEARANTQRVRRGDPRPPLASGTSGRTARGLTSALPWPCAPVIRGEPPYAWR